jgi:DNA-binding response OmpR family regulator
MRPNGLRPGLRILVVDDNQDLAEVIAEFLTEAGCITSVATTGAAGLELVDSFDPNALLLDLGLPDITGFEFVEELRRSGAGADCTIIAVSGYGGEDTKRRSRELGIEHHLVKPVDFESVLGLLTKLFPNTVS